MTIEPFDHTDEDLAHLLWNEINERLQPECEFPTINSCQLFNTKTGELDGSKVTGRPQFARCIYCNKQIAAWGKLGRTDGYGSSLPRPLAAAHAKHTDGCAEAWIWAVLSRWSLGICRSVAEQQAVDTWRVIIIKKLQDVDRYWNRQALARMTGRLQRLPTNDINVVQAIELGLIAGLRYELRDWIASSVPFPKHGTEENPHVFLPMTFGDAEYGVWGMCPCGRLEYRGEDMPLTDRLIGWANPLNSKHQHVKHIEAQYEGL